MDNLNHFQIESPLPATDLRFGKFLRVLGTLEENFLTHPGVDIGNNSFTF